MSRTSVGSIWKETSATFVEHARFAFLLSVDTYQQGNTERQSLKTIFTKDSISLGQMKTLAILSVINIFHTLFFSTVLMFDSSTFSVGEEKNF